MTDPSRPSISEMLHSIIEEEDLDQAYILAEAFNLYLLAIKKRGNRHTLGPQDVQNIFTISRILLSAGELEVELAKLAGRPTKAEVVS